jgi:hypothetical protein
MSWIGLSSKQTTGRISLARGAGPDLGDPTGSAPYFGPDYDQPVDGDSFQSNYNLYTVSPVTVPGSIEWQNFLDARSANFRNDVNSWLNVVGNATTVSEVVVVVKAFQAKNRATLIYLFARGPNGFSCQAAVVVSKQAATDLKVVLGTGIFGKNYAGAAGTFLQIIKGASGISDVFGLASLTEDVFAGSFTAYGSGNAAALVSTTMQSAIQSWAGLRGMAGLLMDKAGSGVSDAAGVGAGCPAH